MRRNTPFALCETLSIQPPSGFSAEAHPTHSNRNAKEGCRGLACDAAGEWLEGEPHRKFNAMALDASEKQLIVKLPGGGAGSWAYGIPMTSA
jgi:hypothetical protein